MGVIDRLIRTPHRRCDDAPRSRDARRAGSRATAPEAVAVRRDAGVYSGREIARRLRRNLAFRYLAGDGPVPDFRTVNRFRLPHREHVAWVLRETGGSHGRRGWGSSDWWRSRATQVRAHTSRHKAMSHARMVAEEARLERECAAIVARMEEVTAAEDNLRRLHALAVACG